jgi:pentose-5-phosphate-3-epimerase
METAASAIAAGANVLVSGSTVFRAKDRESVIRSLRAAGSGSILP